MAMNVIRNDFERAETVGEPAAIRHGIQVNWGGIFAGAFTTLGASAMFLLLGNAIGLGVNNVLNTTAGDALRGWSFVYTLATVLLSFGVGGFATSSIGGIGARSSGMMHGTAQWALSLVTTIVLGAMGSAVFAISLRGLGPTLGNWLFFCVAAGAWATSLVGGGVGAVMAAQEARHARRTTLRNEPYNSSAAA